jgi:hypothetical protein
VGPRMVVVLVWRYLAKFWGCFGLERYWHCWVWGLRHSGRLVPSGRDVAGFRWCRAGLESSGTVGIIGTAAFCVRALLWKLGRVGHHGRDGAALGTVGLVGSVRDLGM